MTIYRVAILALVMLAAASFAAAQNRAYISDNLEAPLRTGPSTENRIIAMLKSGAPTEVLESQTGWSRIRTGGRDGSPIEGWVLSRYLMNRAPWAIQFSALEKENSSLKDRLKPLEDSSKTAEVKEEVLQRQLKEGTEALRKMKTDYEGLLNESRSYLKVKESYGIAQENFERCSQELERLSKESDKLKSSERRIWFLAGALVLLCGLLIGMLIGRQQRRPKSLLMD